MLTIKLLTVSKRKNSTLQPDSTGAREESVSLKAPTTEESPSFLLNWEGGAFPYNYLLWGDHYYWINDCTYERNNLIRLDCTLDVLATYKSYILASTQFVAYSSVSGGIWLPDRRLAVTEETEITESTYTVPSFTNTGVYVLTVLGKNGCNSYGVSLNTIQDLIYYVQTRAGAFQADMMDRWNADTLEEAMKGLADVISQSDLLGNAFENAVSCIKSCLWVPFVDPPAVDTPIYLGNFNSGVSGKIMYLLNYNATAIVSIPWQYNDWRRYTAESIYLYLPFVGVVSIDTAELPPDTTGFYILIGLGYSDGTVCYQVQIERANGVTKYYNTYGGNCAAQMPIGINQQASAGQIVQTALAGIEKAAGELTFGSMASVSAATHAVTAGYAVTDRMHDTTPSIIGGTGGGAGSMLDLRVHCWSVARKTVINPGDQTATMGVPTQKPLQLSSCSGYCQCVNAHVSAPAHGDSLNAIDMFLNSGFYIE